MCSFCTVIVSTIFPGDESLTGVPKRLNAEEHRLKRLSNDLQKVIDQKKPAIVHKFADKTCK